MFPPTFPAVVLRLSRPAGSGGKKPIPRPAMTGSWEVGVEVEGWVLVNPWWWWWWFVHALICELVAPAAKIIHILLCPIHSETRARDDWQAGRLETG